MTKIRSTVDSLLDAVMLVSRFSDTTKFATQQQRSVVLSFDPDGLRVECADGFTVAGSAAVSIVPIGFEPGAAVAVHVGKLKELLGMMPGSQVDLEIKGHEDTRPEDDRDDAVLDAVMHATVDRQKFDLYGRKMSGSMMPDRGAQDQKCRFVITAGRLLDLLGIGLACAANKKDSPANIGSLHFVQEHGERLALSATDGYRAGLGARPITGFVGSVAKFSIDYPDARRLAGVLRGFEVGEVVEVQAWGRGAIPERLILDFDWGLKIDMPAVNTVQPDVEGLIDQRTFDRPLHMSGDDLSNALEASRIFAEGGRVRLNYNPRGYWWSSRNLAGDIARRVHVDELDQFAGDPVDIHLDYKFIADFIGATRSPMYTLFYQGTHEPMLIHPQDDDRDRLMIMPMIFSAPTTDDVDVYDYGDAHR